MDTSPFAPEAAGKLVTETLAALEDLRRNAAAGEPRLGHPAQTGKSNDSRHHSGRPDRLGLRRRPLLPRAIYARSHVGRVRVPVYVACSAQPGPTVWPSGAPTVMSTRAGRTQESDP